MQILLNYIIAFITIYEEYFKADEMLLLSTILPGHDLFHTLAAFETFLSDGWFCLVMNFLERILTGPGWSLEVLCAVGVC